MKFFSEKSPNLPDYKARHGEIQEVRGKIMLHARPYTILRKTECRKVIAFSVFGTTPFYWVGAVENMRLQPAVYPGWVCRYYVGSDVPKKIVEELLKGSEVYKMHGPWPGLSGAGWRFLVAADPSVDRFICRDADSRLSPRESAAVAEWEGTKHPLHLIYDHWRHAAICAGLWGGTHEVLPEMMSLLSELRTCVAYGSDEEFLRKHVYSKFYEDHLVHCGWQCNSDHGVVKWLTVGDPFFVGSAFR